jgi:hypothetical protein
MCVWSYVAKNKKAKSRKVVMSQQTNSFEVIVAIVIATAVLLIILIGIDFHYLQQDSLAMKVCQCAIEFSHLILHFPDYILQLLADA